MSHIFGQQIESLDKSWRWAFTQEPIPGLLQRIGKFLKMRFDAGAQFFPPLERVFASMAFFPIPETRVVIVGQDPYHGPGQANGLAFSVSRGVMLPPSLRNIFQEVSKEYQVPMRQDGDLSDWAKQGVLLLNRVLTVEAGTPLSHRGIGWEQITDFLLFAVARYSPRCVFMLWGREAQGMMPMLTQFPQHLVLTAAHPSPLSASRGFFGCRHFTSANEWLNHYGRGEIKWHSDMKSSR